MIATILPFIQGALMLAQLGSTLSGPPAPPPPPEPPPTLGWDEAMRQATETLSPIYDERLQNTLAGVDKDKRNWRIQLWLRALSRVKHDHRDSTLIPLFSNAFKVNRKTGILLFK